MTRISTLANHNLVQAQMIQTQKRISELQIQLSTGSNSQRYTGIASESQRLVNLENTRVRNEQYLESNAIVDLRLQTMELSVAESFDIATELKTLLVNALNVENAAELPVNQSALDMMDEIAKVLNAKIGDRYLFSGTATGTIPVDLNAAGFNPPPASYPSNVDTAYYQGDGTQLTARVADDFDVTWGVTADEPGFEQLIRALHLTATATTSPTVDRLRLDEALTVVNQAIDSIPGIRSRLGLAQRSIDQANTTHDDLNLFLDENITEIKAVDIPLAVTKLTSSQITLEASFATVARLASLTLTSFLR